MTDKQPEALRLADELEEPLHDFPEPTTLEAEAASELRRQHAELETLRAKLKTYEDLGGAADDVQLLRMGYAAAQQVAAYAALPEPLEIDWPELHSQALGCGVEDRGLHNRYECAEYGWQDGVDKCAERVPEQIFDADQMHAFADATHTLRASHGQAPAQTADSQLLQFYGVTTDAELIAAQAAHIEKLQAKLTKTPSFAPQRVREG